MDYLEEDDKNQLIGTRFIIRYMCSYRTFMVRLCDSVGVGVVKKPRVLQVRPRALAPQRRCGCKNLLSFDKVSGYCHYMLDDIHYRF